MRAMRTNKTCAELRGTSAASVDLLVTGGRQSMSVRALVAGEREDAALIRDVVPRAALLH
jgi:hypothetical protein